MPVAVLDGESLEHMFLVRLKPATVTFTFLIFLIVASEWELLVHLLLYLSVNH